MTVGELSMSTDEQKHGWIVTFYAFKGGTGRTLALSNVARYLAESRGYRVGLIDLDLESPGLPHESLCELADKRSGAADISEQARQIDEFPGFANLFMRAMNGESVSDAIPKHVCPLPSEKGCGALFVMPTAEGSASRTSEFRRAIENFEQIILSRPPEDCTTVTADIIHEWIQQYSLDYVLIDGRTGVGPFSPIYTLGVPHALALFVGLNDQNIQGSLALLNQAYGDLPLAEVPPEAPVFLICSPVPTTDPKLLETRLTLVESRLRELCDERRPNVAYVYELPDQATFLLPYSDLAAYREAYFPAEAPRSALAKEYLRIAQALESLELQEPGHVALQETRLRRLMQALSKIETPIHIDVENICLEPLQDFLGKYGVGLSWERGGSEAEALFKLDNRAVVTVRLWGATDPRAPWGSDPTSHRGSDIVTIPQSKLSQFARSAAPLDEWVAEQSSFLDRWYPGWRRWGVASGQAWGLPFSMNTMLMVANETLIRDCWSGYWKHLGDASGTQTSAVPSNWHVLLAVIRSSTATIAPYRIAGHERALYYEWLNVVLGFGGRDMELVEGGLPLNVDPPPLLSEATIRGTDFFIRLAGATATESKEICERKMDALVAEFASKKLAAYSGWTDALRFESGKLRTAAVGFAQQAQDEGEGVADLVVRLGRPPREMRSQRRPLVANWIATVAAREPHRREVALLLLHEFLEPDTQRRLVRNGFASSSLPVVEAESQRLILGGGEGTHSPYAIFLATLRDALTHGHPVPALPDDKWINGLSMVLGDLLTRALSGEYRYEDAKQTLEEFWRDEGSRIVESVRESAGSRQKSASSAS